ncbi:MAG TPA: sulfotransferase [Thermoguttaceae bacterium]|nr:sulfotransferase [Thermoguttaceae bacterium]
MIGSKAGGGFPSYPPLVKIGLWILAIVASALAVQAIAWVLGLEFDILAASGGRGLLLALALATLLAVMAADRRPAADYGLAVGGNWAKHWFGGLGLGILTYSGYCAAAWLMGAFTLRTDSLSGYRCASAGLSAMTAVPVAVTQQIIFSGYLLSTLRDRYRPAVAVAVAALLFAVLARLDRPAELLEPGGWRLCAGLFLIAGLLGLLRLRLGSIPFPAGLLAGWIFVRRLTRKTSLLAVGGDGDVVDWMAPGSDPRQAPVLWILLGIAVGVCWYLLRRKGESNSAAGQPALHASFKRVFPFSNLNALAPLDLWLRGLIDARFRVGLKYIPRMAAILVFSTLNTILSLPERILLPWLLRRRVPDPVFIVGIHRSGTTHLQNLLSLDKTFCSPRMHQIINPVGFLSFGWLTTPLFGPFLTWKRPMDAVRMSIFTPQEEEFALAGMSRLSPYWELTFPRRAAKYDRYIFPERFSRRERKAWKRTYLHFLRKLTFWSGKRPLLKNPYNTARVLALREMFPRAKFIHICRHPHAVYSSNMHLAREGFVVFQVQDPDERDSYSTRFLDNYRATEEAFDRDAAGLPDGDVSRVRFEDLERDPIAEIRRIYGELGLEFHADVQQRLQRYLDRIAGYQKNRFKELPEEKRAEIDRKMGPFLRKWGYVADDAAPDVRQAKAA